MHTGSCLCGQINYTIASDSGPIIYCHCKRCRKSSGSAFVTSMQIERADFKVASGQDFIKIFHHDGGVDRAFCSNCGSQLFSTRAATPDLMRIRLGTFDSEVDSKVSSHIFVDSKAEWHDILDNAPQHAQRP
ncbi:MAG: GFA family protein [Betaproteobacteria bacterium]